MAASWAQPSHARTAELVGGWFGVGAARAACILPPPPPSADDDDDDAAAASPAAAAAAAAAVPFRWVALPDALPGTGLVVFCTVGVSDVVVHGTAIGADDDAIVELRQEYLVVAKAAQAVAPPEHDDGTAAQAAPAKRARRPPPKTVAYHPALIAFLYSAAAVMRKEAYATSEAVAYFSYLELDEGLGVDSWTVGGVCTAAPAMLAALDGSLPLLRVAPGELPIQLVALVPVTDDECLFLKMVLSNDDDDDEDDDEDDDDDVSADAVQRLLTIAQREHVDLADLERESVSMAKDFRRKAMERQMATMPVQVSRWLAAFFRQHNVRAGFATMAGVREALRELNAADVRTGGWTVFEVFCTFGHRGQLSLYVALKARRLDDTKLALAIFDELATDDLAGLVKLSTMPVKFDELPNMTFEHSDGKYFFNADVNNDDDTRYWDALRNRVVDARRRAGQSGAPSETSPLLPQGDINGDRDEDGRSCCALL